MIRSLLQMLVASLAFSAVGYSQTYSTSFDGTENPLSEGGVWTSRPDLQMTDVRKVSGIAKGTQDGSGRYDDSGAMLSGFSPDQTVMGVLYSVGENAAQYFELWLRMTNASGHVSGYEVEFRNARTTDQQITIYKWNDFPNWSLPNGWQVRGAGYGVSNGDTIQATALGNILTVYVNGVQKLQVTDSEFPTGNPGFGFYVMSSQSPNTFGLTSFSATGDLTGNVDSTGGNFPRRFSLDQNYPNPFNPDTVIRYELPVASFVDLTVFDTLGRKIVTLVNEQKSAGRHSVTFSASHLSSGIYLYRLRAGEFVQTQKMLLLR